MKKSDIDRLARSLLKVIDKQRRLGAISADIDRISVTVDGERYEIQAEARRPQSPRSIKVR